MRTSALLAAFLFLAAAPAALSQTKAAPKAGALQPAQLRDGVFREHGITMRLQAGEVSRLSAPVILANGTEVRTNGIIVQPDGTRQLLPNGHAITMQGGIVLLKDDMLTPRAIDQRAQALRVPTGANRFAITTTSAEVDKQPVPPRLAAMLLRTEHRLALLQEMTEQVAQRIASKSAATAPLDRQISQLDNQLQQGASAPAGASDAPVTDAPARP